MRAIFVPVAISLLLSVGCTRSSETAPIPASEPGANNPAVEADTKLEPVADQSPVLAPAKLKIIGTEPFWGIDIDGDRLHFTTMDDQVGRWLEAVSGATDDGRWQWSGKVGDGGKFSLDIVRDQCSDGMSDRVYAYTAHFSIDQKEYRGCADDPEKFSGEGQQP